ncbi:hypothetical protein DFH06DRAFT_1145381 [Mycena polygramma]|nr:hypothetical protein DFH06DRAFT_1145381 [Mycena polygramma]
MKKSNMNWKLISLSVNGKTAPGMQDLAQEVSTKGAKGVGRNVDISSKSPIHWRQFMSERIPRAKGRRTPTSQRWSQRRRSRRGELSRGDLAMDQRWKGSLSGSLIRRMRGSHRSIGVFAHPAGGRAQVVPDGERAPLLVHEWRTGRWHGLERASASVTGVSESSVEACERMSGGHVVGEGGEVGDGGSKRTRGVSGGRVADKRFKVKPMFARSKQMFFQVPKAECSACPKMCYEKKPIRVLKTSEACKKLATYFQIDASNERWFASVTKRDCVTASAVSLQSYVLAVLSTFSLPAPHRAQNPSPLSGMQPASLISPTLVRSWREDARQLARLPRHSAMRCREPTESPKVAVKTISKPVRTEKTLEEKGQTKHLTNKSSFGDKTAQSISTEEIPGPRGFHKRLATKRAAGVGARPGAASVIEAGEQLAQSSTSDSKSEACEATGEGPGEDVAATHDDMLALILLADTAVKSLDSGVDFSTLLDLGSNLNFLFISVYFSDTFVHQRTFHPIVILSLHDRIT